MAQDRVRNFSIIAHIDHGKSTLADRLLERTGTVEAREMRDQVLDAMDLERERGITIKSHPVRLRYKRPEGEYTLHLIDTPGHVDFRYEVSRALAAVEGALVVVDVSQGIEAQTLANIDLALEEDLKLIPVLNKIDLPGAEVERTIEALEEIGFDRAEMILASAKEGRGIDEILAAIVERIPPPSGRPDAPLRALIFDSIYDPYLGAVAYVRVVDGEIRRGRKIRLMARGTVRDVVELGTFRLGREACDRLVAGDVGYVAANLKDVADVAVGDTITVAEADEETGEVPAIEPLAGYREPLPMVFAGLYPIEGDRYEDLRSALAKLRLNDAALVYEPETSGALGFGFRCGFLGLLHMEIVQERLEREFDAALIVTAPSVEYRVRRRDGTEVRVENPAKWPNPGEIEEVLEPVLEMRIYAPEEYVGPIMRLCQEKRGTFHDMHYVGTKRVVLRYDLPLAEVVLDFFDRLKSSTRGYASLDYAYKEHRPADLVRLDILVNEDPVDALATIVHRDRAYAVGRALAARLKEVIPRQQFAVPVQAAVGSRVIARETIKAMGKNVTAKCYGGDVTRKRKLLEKQKEGKKRMKSIGTVEIPQEAFVSILSVR